MLCRVFYCGVKYEYTYDDAGNITEIYENDELKYAYEYDELNQLTLDYDAEQGTETYYTYDNGGNILNKAIVDAEAFEVLSETDYEYNDAEWKDLLTSYDGEAITYDGIGNPLSYRGYTMTWENGRKLASLSGNGVTASYKYDCDGLRTQKTVNGVTSKYYYDGTQLIAEERGSDKLFFYYDVDGVPTGIKLNDTIYYYRSNAQGDVTGIYNEFGILMCEYKYNAWGKILCITDADGISINNASHIANINPLRYRGYYYDNEVGLYYLKNRYYDCDINRFINSDNIVGTRINILEYNSYLYCANNPIMREDPLGTSWILNGVVYKYDGTMADFHRAERGLPPIKYSEALLKASKKEQTGSNQHLPSGGKTQGGWIVEPIGGTGIKTDSITYIPPDVVKDMYKNSTSYFDIIVSSSISVIDFALGEKLTGGVGGALLMTHSILGELKSKYEYDSLCDAIKIAANNGNGLVIIEQPYCTDTRANSGNSWSMNRYYEWSGVYGNYPIAINPYA